MADPEVRISREHPEGVEVSAMGWRARFSWIRVLVSLLLHFPIPSELSRDPRRRRI